MRGNLISHDMVELCEGSEQRGMMRSIEKHPHGSMQARLAGPKFQNPTIIIVSPLPYLSILEPSQAPTCHSHALCTSLARHCNQTKKHLVLWTSQTSDGSYLIKKKKNQNKTSASIPGLTDTRLRDWRVPAGPGVCLPCHQPHMKGVPALQGMSNGRDGIPGLENYYYVAECTDKLHWLTHRLRLSHLVAQASGNNHGATQLLRWHCLAWSPRKA